MLISCRLSVERYRAPHTGSPGCRRRLSNCFARCSAATGRMMTRPRNATGRAMNGFSGSLFPVGHVLERTEDVRGDQRAAGSWPAGELRHPQGTHLAGHRHLIAMSGARRTNRGRQSCPPSLAAAAVRGHDHRAGAGFALTFSGGTAQDLQKLRLTMTTGADAAYRSQRRAACRQPCQAPFLPAGAKRESGTADREWAHATSQGWSPRLRPCYIFTAAPRPALPRRRNGSEMNAPKDTASVIEPRVLGEVGRMLDDRLLVADDSGIVLSANSAAVPFLAKVLSAAASRHLHLG